MNLNGAEYFYVRNAQGDIIGLIDGDGVRVVSYAYDSWGKPIVTDAEKNDVNDTIKDGVTGSLANTVGVKNPYRYRAYRYDAETSLYYLQSRYYNPEWGRFINMDSLGGKIGVLLSHNVFAYCNNNAVNMVDPNGHWSIAISFAAEVIGGILATAATILSSPVIIAGAAIMATAFLGYAAYTYYTSSSGSVSYSAESSDTGSVEEVSSGTGGGGGSISPEPPKSNKKPKKTTHGHHSYPKYLEGAAAQKLIEIAPDLHKKVHSLIHQFEGGWLVPKRGYTGRIIQNIYTPKQIQDGLIRFYNSVDEFKDLIEPLKNAIEYTMGR